MFICKMEPPFARKFRNTCMKNQKDDFSLLSKQMPFKCNRLTLLAIVFSLQFTEISEYRFAQKREIVLLVFHEIKI